MTMLRVDGGLREFMASRASLFMILRSMVRRSFDKPSIFPRYSLGPPLKPSKEHRSFIDSGTRPQARRNDRRPRVAELTQRFIRSDSGFMKLGLLRRPVHVIALFCATLISASHAAESTPKSPPPAEAFFALPQVRQPRLSPDGTKIAFLFPRDKKMALGLFDRGTKESKMILRAPDESIHRFFWKGNDRIVFEADVAGNESFFIGSTDLTGKRVLRISESQRIDNNLTGDFAGIVDSLKHDPERIAVIGFFAGNIDNSTFVGGAPVIARLNVRNRALSTLVEIKDTDRY